jgi:hypothetical protein
MLETPPTPGVELGLEPHENVAPSGSASPFTALPQVDATGRCLSRASSEWAPTTASSVGVDGENLLT